MGSSLDDGLVWKALSHPVRRAILDVLHEGPASTGAVVEAVGGGRHAVLQHLAVLREADLVHTGQRGRQRINTLNPVPLRLVVGRWMSRYEGDWVEALVGLRDTVESASRDDQGEESNDAGASAVDRDRRTDPGGLGRADPA